MNLESAIRNIVKSYVESLTSAASPNSIYGENFNSMVEKLSKFPCGKYLSDNDYRSEIFNAIYDSDTYSIPLDGASRESWNSSRTSRLTSFFLSIPRAYRLIVELPAASSSVQFETLLTPDIAIAAMPRSFASAAGNIWNFNTPTDQTSYSLNLIISCIGYANSSANSEMASTAIGLVKQFAFITTNSQAQINFPTGELPTATFYEVAGQEVGQLHLPGTLPEALSRISFNEPDLGVFAGIDDAKFLHTEYEKQALLQFRKFTEYLGLRSEPDFSRLAAAIEWSMDAETSGDHTLAYISACIGLEALLGSAEHMQDMTKRIADRFAFLIGKNDKARESLRSELIGVFHVRGQLVHAREARLRDKNIGKLSKAKALLNLAIFSEMSNLKEVKKIPLYAARPSPQAGKS